MSPTIASGDAHDVYTTYLARRETRYQQIAAFQAALDAHADAVEDELLNEVIKTLPTNYNFEIHKSIWRIEETKKTLGKKGGSC